MFSWRNAFICFSRIKGSLIFLAAIGEVLNFEKMIIMAKERAETIKTAEELAGEQREISVAEFFEKNRHLLGFDNPAKALLTVVREAVDNSLDAAEEARILPEIEVKIKQLSEDRFHVAVQDNGPGIMKEQIGRIFGKLLYGSKFGKGKQSLTADAPILIEENGKMQVAPIGRFIDSFVQEGEGIKDVSKLNIAVPAFDWKNYKYSFKKVSHLIKHKRENEVIEFTTETNRKIKVTGCHSLFMFNKETCKVEEVEARNLKEGDLIVSPGKLPSGNLKEINILNYINIDDIKNNWLYVYGIDKKFLINLFGRAGVIHKKTDKSRKYYRFNTPDGIIDVLDDSLKQYVQKGFLPLHLFIKLGLKEFATNETCIQSYYHGSETQIPVLWEISPSLMRFLGLFVAEGHSDNRQIGFTFGLHEDYLVDEIAKTARNLGSNITIERRESSIRVKVFGGILSILLGNLCGRGAHNKKVPEFAFRTSEELGQYFLDGLYQGDGHNVPKRNQLMLNTVSERLANEVMYLWLMQGVVASVQKRISQGLGKNPTECFAVNVYGNSINKSHLFKSNKPLKSATIVSNKYLLKSKSETASALDVFLNSDLCLLKIRSVKVINEGNEFVYDISVPECENFVGGFGGISCHNSRGQQGIGISAAVLYAQLTSGKPVIIYSRTSEKKPVHVFHLRIDTVKNEPQIVKEETVDDKIKEHGVRIEMELEGKYIQRQQSVEEYLKQTAIVNPFATISYSGPENIKMKFTRITEKLPVQPVGIKPHPHGVEIGVLDRMLKLTSSRNLSSFLVNEFCRVGSGTAKEICKNANLDTDLKPKEMEHEQIEKLWKAIQATPLMKPPLDCLSPITAPLLESSLKKEFKLEFVASVTRPATVYRGNPFQIECCIGYGGELKPDAPGKIMRFANRVPLMYQASACAMTKALSKVDWRHYKIDQQGGMPQGPIVVLVHICSAWVPYTSEGKEAIASYPDIIKEVKLAVQECARKLGYYLSGRRRLLEQKERQNLFEKYIPEAAVTLSYLSGASKEKIITGLQAMLKKVDIIATDSFADNGGKPEESKKDKKKKDEEIEEEEKEE